MLTELADATQELSDLERHEHNRVMCTDLQDRVNEFQRNLAKGSYQDAGWCVKALGKILEDLKAESSIGSEQHGAGEISGSVLFNSIHLQLCAFTIRL